MILVFGLECPRSHSSECRRWSKFDESFKLKALKEQILDFDPMSGGGKLISEQLNKNNIHELLSLFRCSPVILIPLLENLV